jgi:hypothetical protein
MTEVLLKRLTRLYELPDLHLTLVLQLVLCRLSIRLLSLRYLLWLLSLDGLRLITLCIEAGVNSGLCVPKLLIPTL